MGTLVVLAGLAIGTCILYPAAAVAAGVVLGVGLVISAVREIRKPGRQARKLRRAADRDARHRRDFPSAHRTEERDTTARTRPLEPSWAAWPPSPCSPSAAPATPSSTPPRTPPRPPSARPRPRTA